MNPGVTRWASLELGIGWEQEFLRPGRTLYEDEPSPVSGLRALLGACGPVVCLEMVRHPLPFEPRMWLQPRMDSLARTRTEGEFWSAMATREYSGAWERRLSLRAGSVRYELAECPGLWKGFHQELGLRDLPAGPFRFGASLEWIADRAAVRGEFGLAPSRPGARTGLEISPLLVSLAFRRMGEMQISLRSRLDFPDPFPALARRWNP